MEDHSKSYVQIQPQQKEDICISIFRSIEGVNLVQWTQEEEDKLLELYARDYAYGAMAEALPGKSVGAVRGKLLGLKREKREDTYIGARGSAHTEKSPFHMLNFG